MTGGAAPPCPLHESAYLDPTGRRRGLITAAVERAYAEAGLALSPSASGELPDHVALELEFLSHLCAGEETAWRRRRADEAAAFLDRERRFLDEHLLRFLPSLVRRVRESGSGFYTDAAAAGHAFVLHDRDLISLLLEGRAASVSRL